MIPNEEELIEKVRRLTHKTPYFYTSRDILKHNYQSFTHLFDNAEIYYALKANSDSKILAYLDSLGCGFEAASAYEIDMLLKVGVNPHKIIYGTSIKPLEHIEHAMSVGINRFAADAPEELEKIAVVAPGSKVFIRTIVEDSGSVFQMSERFGAPVSAVKGLLLRARDLGLKAYGVSFYVGSQATEASRWANGVKTVAPVIQELYDEGIELEVLNIGGGFPIAYSNHKAAPKLPEIVARIHHEIHQLPYIPKIIMEPGRGIAGTAAVLVAEVISRTTRNGKVWLCLDAGIYNALYEAMIHQGATQYDVHPFTPLKEGSELMVCTLAGPTGDSLDVIARNVALPSNTMVGDKVIFENAGAYTSTMHSPFNGFPKPDLYIG